MPTIKAGEITLEYYIDGDGPPLLLIQGLGGHAYSWGEPLIEDLSRDFTVIRFSNSGLGISERMAGTPTVARMADDAANLLTALGIEKAHVFGISMGGMIAQELALNHPERALTVTLGCTGAGQKYAPSIPPEDIAKLSDMSGTVEERARRTWPYVLGTAGTDNPLALAAVERELEYTLQHPMPEDLFFQHIGAVMQHDTHDRRPQVTVPTLIIHGDADRLVNRAHAAVLHERIPGSQVRYMPSLGHLFFNEDPHATANIIREFIAAAVPAAV